MGSLEDKITSDNPVRFIDAFVGIIDLQKIEFEPRVLKTEGRPSFKTEVFLKLYLYGYLNGIRSSRKLERECFRNIEVQWLVETICIRFSFLTNEDRLCGILAIAKKQMSIKTNCMGKGIYA
jgi:transposase